MSSPTVEKRSPSSSPRSASGLTGLAALSIVVLALAPASARAGNDDGVLHGSAAVLTAGALTAIVDDGSATWYNPAGLAAVTQDSIDLNLAVYALRLGFTPGLLRAADGPQADGDYVDYATIPSATTLVRRIDRMLVFGLGLFVPSLRSHDGRVSITQPVEGGSYDWALVVHDIAQTYNASLGLGVSVAPNFRFGVSLYASYSQDIGNSSFVGTGTGADGEVTYATSTISNFWTRTVDVSMGVGLQWEPVPGLFLGLMVRSPFISLGSFFRDTRTTIVAESLGITVDPSDEMALEPQIALVSPTRVQAGIALHLADIVLTADGDLRHELITPELGVNQGTIGGVRIGVRGRLDDAITLGAGLFTDLTADRRRPVYGRTVANYIGVSGGVEIRSVHHLADASPAGSAGADASADAETGAPAVAASGAGANTIEFVHTLGFRYAYGTGRIGGLELDASPGAPQITSVAVPTTVHEVAFMAGTGIRL